ncbi:hypothetical protein ACGLDM_004636 [Salmonella enterica subsp. enterica serovar Braenderup]|uniref:hypothetical protein n=1 Tax=Salmonella enterica TaxID=28901 RepID=UPI00107BF556|nr:hypothetical protein [Salmonella enterica]EBU9919292.1 hypothetical protein [Salmonella enterica subsp. enterica serovar Weybridge]ECE0087098.1 hypothetical protein [Salmonella enterica subsp. enterica serovar Poona]EDF0013899.1 hypothetical protein [Salmonella enterica subsp. enterica serovar Enteritidis]HCJ8476902.1 hypothetical protein [Escherichia coli]EAB2889703.1 hypothetical protein [Salmonella enterica]
MEKKTVKGYVMEVTPKAAELAKEYTDCILPLTSIVVCEGSFYLIFGSNEPVYAYIDDPDQVTALSIAMGKRLSDKMIEFVVGQTMDIIRNPVGHSGIKCKKWQLAWLAH